LLDAMKERPEQRVFRQRPTDMVLADRGKYIAACLTIVRAYVTAGYPGKLPPLASFEGWSDNVRSALCWLGCADPVDSLELARAEDPDQLQREGMITARKDAIGIKIPRTTAQLIVEADKTLQ
jgi:putative DNA primase/helicase